MARTVEEVFKLAEELHGYKPSDIYFQRDFCRMFDLFKSPRWNELVQALSEDRIFRCSECGEMLSFNDLKSWCCDFNDLENGLICSCCYEEGLGEDL